MPLTVDPAWGLAGTLVLGWVWGSFLNQVADRTPPRAAGATPAAPEAAAGERERRPLSLLHPRRSFCFGCGRLIPWTDNLPVFSYLLLRGRCRRCGHPIGRRTLVLEVAVPVAFAGLLLAPARPPGLALLALGWGVASWSLLAAVLVLERRRLSPALRAMGAALTVAASAFILWGG